MNQTNAMGMGVGMGNGMESSVACRIPATLCDKTVSAEVSGDCILPDYLPGIRRVLSVGQTALPPACYTGASAIELNGTVDYRILYLGEDGGLYTLPMTTQYDQSLPVDTAGYDLNEGITVFATAVCEPATVRVTAPGRLSLRGRVRIRLRAYGQRIHEEECEGEADLSSICRLQEESPCMTVRSITFDPLTLNEELGGFAVDARIAYAKGTPLFAVARMEDRCITATGELILSLLICGEGEHAEAVERRIPFRLSAECVGMGDPQCLSVDLSVGELELTAEEGRILCEVTLLGGCELAENLPLNYTVDLFSTAKSSSVVYEDYVLPISIKGECRSISQSERISAAELNLPEGARVLFAEGTAILDHCERSGGKYLMTGQSSYRLLWVSNGEYGFSELVLPLRYETEGGEEEPESFDARCLIPSCRVGLEGDTLSLDAEISISCVLLGARTVRTVTGAEFGAPIQRRGESVTVCYPAPGEDAWAVAKRYAVAPEALTECAGREGGYYLI